MSQFQENPPREHTQAFDLTGYDSANARVVGHNLETNARSLGKLRVENAPRRGRLIHIKGIVI